MYVITTATIHIMAVLSCTDNLTESLLKAEKLLNASKGEQALKLLNGLIAENQTSALAYYYRGMAHANLSHVEESMSDFSQAILLDPKFADAYTERGRMLLAKREWKRSIADLTLANELSPDKPMILHWRGVAHYEAGNYSKAIADFELGYKLDQDFSGLYNDLIWTMVACPDPKIRNGKRAMELAINMKAVLGKAGEHSSLELIAAAHAELSEYKEAVAVQKVAVQLLAAKNLKARLKRADERLKSYENSTPLRYRSWVNWY